MQSVLEVLDKCAAYFSAKGVPNPKFDAQMLLARALKCKRLELFLQFERPMSDSELSLFRDFARRRAKREPLQHILGEVEFFGLRLKCDRRALIPRPETEEMLDNIIKLRLCNSSSPAKILDLGTGSGAMALALAKHFPDSSVLAVDASDQALELARENASVASIRNIEIRKSDWFENIDESFDLIVANPPYLNEIEISEAEPEVREFDPISALLSPDNGMRDLRKILGNAPKHLNCGGFLVCECGLGQAEKLSVEFSNFYGKIDTAKDLSHVERYIFCQAK